MQKSLDYTFYVVIAIMMFLCFFSLVASMTSNLLEQTKEIGIMRAIGIPKPKIHRLYFYEALVLVLSSCILGVCVGLVVAYTMALQMDAILDTGMEMIFPWSEFLQTVILSLVCAFFSTQGPCRQITGMAIAQAFRQ